MKRLAFFAFILGLSSSALSQFNESHKADGQVNYQKPSVYLEYICQDKKNLRFRMSNNTIWSIAVGSSEGYHFGKKKVKLANGKTFYAMPSDREVSVIYRVDKFAQPWRHVEVPKLNYSDSSSTNWIASEDSVLFSVPVEYLRNDLQILVNFNYEWELAKSGFFVNGPEHWVTFRGIDLPESQRPCT